MSSLSRRTKQRKLEIVAIAAGASESNPTIIVEIDSALLTDSEYAVATVLINASSVGGEQNEVGGDASNGQTR